MSGFVVHRINALERAIIVKKIRYYENKLVLVVGLGKSGSSAARLLRSLKAAVILNDAMDLSNNQEAKALEELGVRIVSGGHPFNLLDEPIDLVVKNPGIPYDNPLIEKVLEKEIPVVTEVELAYEVCEGSLVGITGTNGKTTTTQMLTEIMNTDRIEGRAFAAGNIGYPASEVVKRVSENDELIMELSSFQLMGTRHYKPSIAVLTNIFSAHLDYHGSREEYVKAKMNITKNQDKKDMFVYNYDLPELRELAGTSNATLIPFSTKEKVENGAYVERGTIFFRGESIMETQELGSPGEHNVENALAAVAAAKLLHQTNENIRACLMKFTGVEHRLQFITEYKQRKFYNDSKATNTLATIQALKSFEQPIVLMAGGLHRGNQLNDLIPYLSKHVKGMVVFGETAELLAQTGRKANVEQIIEAETMKEAVHQAYNMSDEGDVLLLSPACASWDHYTNFEERGNDFIQSVHTLMGK